MTPGTEPALSADEWLSGVNRGKVLIGMYNCKFVLVLGVLPCLVTENNIKLYK